MPFKKAERAESVVRRAVVIRLYEAALTAVIAGLTSAVTLGGHDVMMLWSTTFTSFLICSLFAHCLLPASLVVYRHGSYIKYIPRVTWPDLTESMTCWKFRNPCFRLRKMTFLAEILCPELPELMFQSWRPLLRKISIFKLHQMLMLKSLQAQNAKHGIARILVCYSSWSSFFRCWDFCSRLLWVYGRQKCNISRGGTVLFFYFFLYHK